jgi:hypothetical protein
MDTVTGSMHVIIWSENLAEDLAYRVYRRYAASCVRKRLISRLLGATTTIGVLEAFIENGGAMVGGARDRFACRWIAPLGLAPTNRDDP